MPWNHRVIRRTYTSPSGETETIYGIHEVFSDHFNPNLTGGPTAEPVEVVADSVEGLGWTLDKMKEALDKPVLDMDDCVGKPM